MNPASPRADQVSIHIILFLSIRILETQISYTAEYQENDTCRITPNTVHDDTFG